MTRHRIWAEGSEYPEGHMYLPEDMSPFIFNTNGNVICVSQQGNFKGASIRIPESAGYKNVVALPSLDITDKQGAEIFVGDIFVIERMSRLVTEVVYVLKANMDYEPIVAAYALRSPKFQGGVIPLDSNALEFGVVAGNKFEHPELFKEVDGGE